MNMRPFSVWLHRWAGLSMAGFLIVVGLTGSLLAFLPELNHWLAPELYPGPHGIELDPATLARRAEALVPQARVRLVLLDDKFSTVGTARVIMESRPGAPPLDFQSLYLDSVTGDELGRTKWGGLPRALKEITSFIYDLHMNLAAGHTGGWILGIVALVWTIDCFVAFYLTLPSLTRSSVEDFLKRWKPAWLVKWRASAYRINFDLHRAGGLWLWATLLIFAWSAVFFNLIEFYTPATKLFLDFEPSFWAGPSAPPHNDARNSIEWEEAQRIGMRIMTEQARERGFTVDRPIMLACAPAFGECQYRVHSSRDIGDKYGYTTVIFDAYTGELRTLSLPTGQRSGNTLTTWLLELHMANLFGLPYKIFVCGLGLVIAMLSVTGGYIWWKKRCARKHRLRDDAARIPKENQPSRLPRVNAQSSN